MQTHLQHMPKFWNIRFRSDESDIDWDRLNSFTVSR